MFKRRSELEKFLAVAEAAWLEDDLSFLLHPEAALFANLPAWAVCAADYAAGAVNLTKAGRSWTSELSGSSSSGHGPPRVHRVTAELAHCLASDQMTLDIEGVVDGGVGGEKPLRRS